MDFQTDIWKIFRVKWITKQSALMSSNQILEPILARQSKSLHTTALRYGDMQQ